MNTHDALIAAVKMWPDEDTPAAELVDFELEFTNATREEAEEHVATLRREARSAAQLVEATNLLASNTRPVRTLKSFIKSRALSRAYQLPVLVVLVPGDVVPYARFNPNTPGQEWQGASVTVGAGFVLREWGLMKCRANATRRARYQRGRRAQSR